MTAFPQHQTSGRRSAGLFCCGPRHRGQATRGQVEGMKHVFLLFLLSAAAVAEPRAVQVDGAVINPHELKATDYALHDVTFSDHGQTKTLKGVLLFEALSGCGLPTLKASSYAVVAEGADGYEAVFGLGELLPDLGNHPVQLVWEGDSARLVTPNDKKESRGVHDLVRLRIAQVPKD